MRGFSYRAWMVVGVSATLIGGTWLALSQRASTTPRATELPAPTMLIESPVAGPRLITLTWLTWFEQMVAAKRIDTAVRAAHELLRKDGTQVRLAADLRRALIQRLGDLVPQMSPRLAAALMREFSDDINRFGLAKTWLNGGIASPNAELRLLATQRFGAADPQALVALLHDADPRVRAAAIVQLKPQTDPALTNAVAAAAKNEPDPRVRSALEHGKMPDFPEQSPDAVKLPVAGKPAPPRVIDAIWDPHEQNRTSVTINPDGTALVVTERDPLGEDNGWKVSYPAWAWVDAAGNTIIDGRDQPVQYLQKPAWDGGTWSPDSLVITPGGQLSSEDDRHQAGDGVVSVPMPNSG